MFAIREEKHVHQYSKIYISDMAKELCIKKVVIFCSSLWDSTVLYSIISCFVANTAGYTASNHLYIVIIYLFVLIIIP